MQDSDDIENLFKHFDGETGQYQEIGRSNEARQSRKRWPLLTSVEAKQAPLVPSVHSPDPLDIPVPAGHSADPIVSSNYLMPESPRVEPYFAPPAQQTGKPVPDVNPKPTPPALTELAEPAVAASPASESIAPLSPTEVPLSPIDLPTTQPSPVDVKPLAAAAPLTQSAAPLPQTGDLQKLFARLAQQPADEQQDKGATLFQRLSRK